MTAQADGYQQPIFQDGEGIIHTDLVALSKINLVRMTDQMLERMAAYIAAAADPDLPWEPGGGTDDWANQSLIYTMSGADGVVTASADHPNDHVQVNPGVIFQKIGGLDFTESSFVPYQVVAGMGDYAIASNASGNPRIDIIQVKLAWADDANVTRDFKDAVTGALSSQSMAVTREATAIISIKQGTPGGTPSYPAPDAGYAVLGAVLVPNGWNGTTGFSFDGIGSGVAILRQCSVPLRVEAITMTPEAFDYSAATNWAHNSNGEAGATGAATKLRVWCPRAGQTKRVIGVGITGAWVTSGVTKLVTNRWGVIGHFAAGELTYDVSGTLVVTGGTLQSKFAHLGHIADASNKSNPSAANGPIGDPLWACGGASGPASQLITNLPASSHFARACLEIDAGNTTVIAEVTWYLAG